MNNNVIIIIINIYIVIKVAKGECKQVNLNPTEHLKKFSYNQTSNITKKLIPEGKHETYIC